MKHPMHTARGLIDLDAFNIDHWVVAHSLAMQCRFNGHTPWFYSVAVHSVNVCRYLEMTGASTRVQLLGLIHDVGEAFVGDVTLPTQKLLGSRWTAEFKEKEEGFYRAVLRSLKLPEPTEQEAAEVHEADVYVGSIERVVFFGDGDPPPWMISRMERPHDGRDLFLSYLRRKS